MLAANTRTQEDFESECPVCHIAGMIRGLSLGEPVFQCSECHLQFLKRSVRPNAQITNDWGKELLEGPSEWAEVFHQAMARAYQRQIKLLEQLVPGKNILDFGSGPGVFLRVAQDLGWNGVGVEVSKYTRDFSEIRYSLNCVENIARTGTRKFDVVRMSHVLEHIPEPLTVLHELREKLKEGGIINVLVPNRTPLTSAVINAMRKPFASPPRLTTAIYPTMHVLGFNAVSLRNTLATAGFEVIKVFSVSMGNPTYYPMLYDGYLNRMPLRLVMKPRNLCAICLDLANNLGNPLKMGTWLVAYGRFRS
jgi:2-polyprenyl-3-methyl-5-hydroxy-6-metoxy-1,4-benzoquinol methylase